jgi:hypothetical protein
VAQEALVYERSLARTTGNIDALEDLHNVKWMPCKLREGLLLVQEKLKEIVESCNIQTQHRPSCEHQESTTWSVASVVGVIDILEESQNEESRVVTVYGEAGNYRNARRAPRRTAACSKGSNTKHS